ncbi:hypothetical protein JTE90_021626 [Oedothorax gibbosus]|uniref:Uncharacterized protein n=1 Tax=Oedothorax gibbosus TaxID=931172 RepID=A0AAV6VQQ9_9ARAC|nr:hypothetical protein JTE90_021626 [Oedothorax gibbosus]
MGPYYPSILKPPWPASKEDFALALKRPSESFLEAKFPPISAPFLTHMSQPTKSFEIFNLEHFVSQLSAR